MIQGFIFNVLALFVGYIGGGLVVFELSQYLVGNLFGIVLGKLSPREWEIGRTYFVYGLEYEMYGSVDDKRRVRIFGWWVTITLLVAMAFVDVLALFGLMYVCLVIWARGKGGLYDEAR